MKLQHYREQKGILAILLVLSLILTGCQIPSKSNSPMHDSAAENKEERELQVMVGFFWGINNNNALTKAVEQFEEEHPGVTVRCEKPPKDEDSLRQLQTQIMAGDGPDVYLFFDATSSLILDPYLAMKNGLFEDISECYDTDVGLDKDSLHTAVMDAGKMENKRYILPFRFDFPVAYVDVAQFKAQGGSLNMFEDGVLSLYEKVLATKNPKLATGLSLSYRSSESHLFNFFSDPMDYENEEVLITEEEVTALLRGVQSARSAEIGNKEPIHHPYLLGGEGNLSQNPSEFWTDYTCMYIGPLYDLLHAKVYSEMTGNEIATIPVTAADGALVADVTQYGAVGYGCEDVELAYEFLRLFVMEDRQTDDFDVRDYGWPVRVKGSVATMMALPRNQECFTKPRILYRTEVPDLTDDNIPILFTEPDRVIFNSNMEYKFYEDILQLLNDQSTGEAMDVDIDTVAAEFVDELKWHLYEG